MPPRARIQEMLPIMMMLPPRRARISGSTAWVAKN